MKLLLSLVLVSFNAMAFDLHCTTSDVNAPEKLKSFIITDAQLFSSGQASLEAYESVQESSSVRTGGMTVVTMHNGSDAWFKLSLNSTMLDYMTYDRGSEVSGTIEFAFCGRYLLEGQLGVNCRKK